MILAESTPEGELPNIRIDEKDTGEMHLIERMQVKPTEKLSKICHFAKDIYNKANYILRHYFFMVIESEEVALEWLKKAHHYLVSNPHDFDKIVKITKIFLKRAEKENKRKNDGESKLNWGWYYPQKGLNISYYKLEKMLKHSPEYECMPAQSAQQTLKKLIADWKGYQKKTVNYWEKRKELSHNEFKKRYAKPPNIPRYKKKDGEMVATFTNQQCKLKGEYLIFPGHTNSRNSPRWLPPLKVRFKGKFSQVEIIPKNGIYIIGIIYLKKKKDLGLDKNRVSSIDIGVNNTIAMVDNIGSRPILVKGGIVKSINQYFNKVRAKLMSIKDKQGYTHWTKRLKKLSLDRYNRLHDIFHKYSRRLIELCIEKNIGTLVIGYNETWKQGVNIGKRNNQNFVSIPFLVLLQKIKYKAELVGIKVIIQEESYTSKCSFLDCEDIGKHRTYKGKRVKRGLFMSSDGRLINADVNAAYNIMRKAIPDVIFADGIEDIVVCPRCVNWLEPPHRKD